MTTFQCHGLRELAEVRKAESAMELLFARMLAITASGRMNVDGCVAISIQRRRPSDGQITSEVHCRRTAETSTASGNGRCRKLRCSCPSGCERSMRRTTPRQPCDAECGRCAGGQLAYESDGVRSATLRLFDGLGRLTSEISSDRRASTRHGTMERSRRSPHA